MISPQQRPHLCSPLPPPQRVDLELFYHRLHQQPFPVGKFTYPILPCLAHIPPAHFVHFFVPLKFLILKDLYVYVHNKILYFV